MRHQHQPGALADITRAASNANHDTQAPHESLLKGGSGEDGEALRLSLERLAITLHSDESPHEARLDDKSLALQCKALIKYTADRDPAVVVAALSCLAQLSLHRPLGTKFFSGENVDNAYRLALHVIGKHDTKDGAAAAACILLTSLIKASVLPASRTLGPVKTVLDAVARDGCPPPRLALLLEIADAVLANAADAMDELFRDGVDALSRVSYVALVRRLEKTAADRTELRQAAYGACLLQGILDRRPGDAEPNMSTLLDTAEQALAAADGDQHACRLAVAALAAALASQDNQLRVVKLCDTPTAQRAVAECLRSSHAACVRNAVRLLARCPETNKAMVAHLVGSARPCRDPLSATEPQPQARPEVVDATITRLELELELRTHELQQALRKARDVEAARRELADLRGEHTQQSDRLSQALQKLVQQAQEMQRRAQDQALLQDKCASMRQANSQLLTELGQAREHHAEELCKARADAAAHSKSVQGLTEKLAAADARGQALAERVDALSAELAEAHAAPSEKAAHCSSLESRLQASSQQADVLDAQLQRAKRHASDLESELAGCKHQLQDARATIEQQQRTLGDTAAELEDSRERLHVAECDLIQLQNAMDAKADECAQLAASLAALQSEAKSAAEQRESLEKELAGTRQALQRQKAEAKRYEDLFQQFVRSVKGGADAPGDDEGIH